MSLKKFYNPQPIDYKQDFCTQMDRNWALIEKVDLEAKEQGTIVGRYIKEQIADGYAIYIVTKEGKRTSTVEVVTGIGDDWVIPSIGRVGSLKTDYVCANIARRDAINKIWKEHAAKQQGN